jgi:hypothetical protein
MYYQQEAGVFTCMQVKTHKQELRVTVLGRRDGLD